MLVIGILQLNQITSGSLCRSRGMMLRCQGFSGCRNLVLAIKAFCELEQEGSNFLQEYRMPDVFCTIVVELVCLNNS